MDSFTYVAGDGTADSNTATVSITITSVGARSVADNSSMTLDEIRRRVVKVPPTWTATR